MDGRALAETGILIDRALRVAFSLLPDAKVLGMDGGDATPPSPPGALKVYGETEAELDSALLRILGHMGSEVGEWAAVARRTMEANREEYREAVQEGFREGLKQEFVDMLEAVKLVVRGLGEVYGIIFADGQLLPIIATWLDRPENGLRFVEPYLQKKYGHLAAAATAFGEMAEDLAALVRPEPDPVTGEVRPSSLFVNIVNLCVGPMAALLVKGHLDPRVARQPRMLGRMVGGYAAWMTVSLVLSATGIGVVMAVARRGSVAAAAVLQLEKVTGVAPIRALFDNTDDLRRVLGLLKTLPRTPGAVGALQRQAQDSLLAVMEQVADYKTLLQRTGAYNDEVASLLLLDGSLDVVNMVPDLQKLKIARGIADSSMLEAHHLVEERVLRGILDGRFPQFRAGFERLGWLSRDDMPAIPVLNELHTRGSSGLARAMQTESDAVMAGHTSLTKLLIKEIDPAKYRSTRDLLAAYRDFYRSRYPRMWKRANLDAHFDAWIDTVKPL